MSWRKRIVLAVGGLLLRWLWQKLKYRVLRRG